MDDLDMLAQRWETAIESNCVGIERRDLLRISSPNTWAKLEASIHRSAQQEVMLLLPSLRQLKKFIDQSIRPEVATADLSKFIGLLHLSIEIVKDNSAALERTPRMLRETCHKVELFDSLCLEASNITLQLKLACIDVGIAVIVLCSSIIKFIRDNDSFAASGSQADAQWQPLEDTYNKTISSVADATTHLESLHRIRPNTNNSDRDSITQSTIGTHHDLAVRVRSKQPIIVNPKNRPIKFFNRHELIITMEEHLQADEEEDLKSLVLYGLAGIGKSSVAYRYAETKLRKKELDASLWIHSEKKETIQRSFTEVALKLKLPGARPADHEENQILVLEWLESTTDRWLIIYDNAEDEDLLRQYWPTMGCGQAVITTRHRSFAWDLTQNRLEVPAWDSAAGSQFLLQLLGRDLGKKLEDNAAESAYQLAEKLSGHALAISQMAGLIHKRCWTIADFLEIYASHGTVMHDFTDSQPINALWDMSFRSLEAESTTVLGILCFLEPDNIPEELFKPAEAFTIPDCLSFCRDKLGFSDAIEALHELALIKRDPSSRTFSLHRLVQSSYLHFMSNTQKQEAYDNASTLVSIAFPRRNLHLAELYTMWPRCARYLPHVLSLKDHFRSQKQNNPEWRALTSYCELNNSCQRYLLEIDNHALLEDLLLVSLMAMDTIPLEEKTIVMEGEVASHTGQMFCRQGQLAKGIEWLEKSYKTFSSEVPFNATESGWAANNLATGFATAKNFPAAIEWYDRAREHWLLYSGTDPKTKGQWPATIKTSTGRGLFWSGDVKRAQELLLQALQELESMRPLQWAGIAEAHYALGNLYRQQRKYDDAECHFMEAQNTWLQGDQLRSAPFNGGCMYKLGCVALDQGKPESAVKHLRDALVVTKMRSTIFLGEHARVLFKLSEALEQELGVGDEAGRLRQEAENLLRKRSPNATNAGVETTYDDLVSVIWR